jgi:hypothetical protein
MASTMRQAPPDGGAAAKAGFEASVCKEEEIWEVMTASSVNHIHASIHPHSTYYCLSINNQVDP